LATLPSINTTSEQDKKSQKNSKPHLSICAYSVCAIAWSLHMGDSSSGSGDGLAKALNPNLLFVIDIHHSLANGYTALRPVNSREG